MKLFTLTKISNGIDTPNWTEVDDSIFPPDELRNLVECGALVPLPIQDAVRIAEERGWKISEAAVKAAFEVFIARSRKRPKSIEELTEENALLRDQIIALEKRLDAKARWPWGDYETILLRHLALAAERYWVNYDPTDATTAPTNEGVKEWLVTQGVTKTAAGMVAQILRADDLPSGPRK